MTPPEVDQELERLFSMARTATLADAGARERIRAGLAPRLASSVTATSSVWGQRLRLGFGVAVLGTCGVAFWLMRAPQANVTPTAAPAPVSTSAVPAFEPAVSGAPAAQAAPVEAPPVSAKPTPPTSAREASKAAPSSTHGADSAEELTLVRAMQQALRSGNPSEALALAADHARRFPRGMLLEEREGVRAVAQCQLASPAARGAILTAFARHFATSPYGARVKAACQ